MSPNGVGEPLDVSVVVSGRNDNWMGTFDQVTQFTCRHNAWVLEKIGARFELIFVEWAPLEDRPLLSERLSAVDPRVRCLVVPKAIHDGFSPRLPFLQYHARNVGVRRARGRIVLATNADILLTPAVARELLELDDHTLLRSPRWDVDQRILQCESPDEALAFAADSVRSVARHALYREGASGGKVPYWTNGAGDFIAMSRSAWMLCEGFHQRTDASMGVDAEMIHQAIAKRLGVRAIDFPVYHVDHPEQQPGRLHFPPYSRHGYANPRDWGLAGAKFEEIAPGIGRCTSSIAGSFARTENPLAREHGGTDASADELVLDAIPRRWDSEIVHVACGLAAGLLAFLDRFVFARRTEFFIWDDGEPWTRTELERYKLRRWPSEMKPMKGVLFWTLEGSAAESKLRELGAVEGLHFAVVDAARLTTISFLRRRLDLRGPGCQEIVLFGFGHNGRYLADHLGKGRFAHGVRGLVYDDDEYAVRRAIEDGWTTLTKEELFDPSPSRVILVTPARPSHQQAAVGTLKGAGLVRGRDFYVRLGRLPAAKSDPSAEQEFWSERRLEGSTRRIYLDPILNAWTPAAEISQALWHRWRQEPAVRASGARNASIVGKDFRWIESWRSLSDLPESCADCWLGVRADERLEAEQAIQLTPMAEETGCKSQPREFLSTLLRKLARRVVRERIVHVGDSRSRTLRRLVDGVRGRPPVISLNLVRSRWGDPRESVESVRRPFPPVKRDPSIDYRCDFPDALAVKLSIDSIGLLVFADVANSWQLREGYEHLTPLLADDGVLAFVGWKGKDSLLVERFLDEILPSDWRLDPLLATEDLLLLGRKSGS